MSELGQTRKSGDAIMTSALPPTADIPESGRDVRKVPGTDIRFSLSRTATDNCESPKRFNSVPALNSEAANIRATRGSRGYRRIRKRGRVNTDKVAPH